MVDEIENTPVEDAATDASSPDIPILEADEVRTLPGDQCVALETLIGMANFGIEPGVTLTVGGTTITGTIIGGARYFDLLADQLKEGISHTELAEQADDLADYFRKLKGIYAPERLEDPRFQTRFVHLNDAQVFAPGAPLGPKGLWRGRLSMVSGFTLNKLSESQ